MERIDPTQITDALLAAAGWARIGLTAPNERLREKAAAELAETIIDALQGPQPVYDERQMPLPL